MPLIATYDARSHQKIQVCNKAEEDGILVLDDFGPIYNFLLSFFAEWQKSLYILLLPNRNSFLFLSGFRSQMLRILFLSSTCPSCACGKKETNQDKVLTFSLNSKMKQMHQKLFILRNYAAHKCSNLEERDTFDVEKYLKLASPNQKT